MERVSEGTPQVDVYVTNTMSKKARKRLAIPANINTNRFTVDSLHPGRLPVNASKASFAATYTDVEALEVSDIIDSYDGLGHGEHVLDMTNFEGEDDTMKPGERKFLLQLQTEGEIRRAETHMPKSLLLFGNNGASGAVGPGAPPPAYHRQATDDEATIEKHGSSHQQCPLPCQEQIDPCLLLALVYMCS